MVEPVEDENGKWSLKGLVNQTPETLKDTVVLVVAFVLGCVGFDPESMWQIGAGGAALLAVLNVFYVRPARKRADEARVLEGIDLGRQLKK
jgi:membrane protein implicated in regulation of membrane protease activity